jgi:hypothetical protein
MDLKQIADGGPFDVAVAIRLLAAKVGALTGELPAPATMDAGDAGAMLERSADGSSAGAAPARKAGGRKKLGADMGADGGPDAGEIEGSV